MRSILIALIAQSLLLTMTGVSSAQETRVTSEASRDAAVAEGVRALSEDVKKLSDDVKELVASIKSQQLRTSTQSNIPTTSEPSPAKTQIPTSATTDALLAHSIQSTFPNAEFRDISLVEAKTIALKTLRESVGFSAPERDEIDRIKDEQNLLKSVEYRYWDLWAAYKTYDARKEEYEAILMCWRVASNGARVEDENMSESLARVWEHSRLELHAALDGAGTPPRARGLRQLELVFRESLGMKIDGTTLRPTDIPNLDSTQLDWAELKTKALKENVWLRGKRRELETSLKPVPNGKLARELAEHEGILTHELASCFGLVASNYASLKLTRDYWEANEQEINIYQTRLRDKVGDQNVLLDNIARAHRRSAQAEIQYHQAASEYSKALTNTKYLCSQLTVGDGLSEK